MAIPSRIATAVDTLVLAPFRLRIWWRYVLLACARAVGQVVALLRKSWARPLGTFALIVATLWLRDVVAHRLKFASDTWFQWSTAIAVFALFGLVWIMRQGRTRLAIEEFTSFAGDQFSQPAKGLSTLLLDRLTSLYRLYVDVDQQSAVPPSTRDGLQQPLRQSAILPSTRDGRQQPLRQSEIRKLIPTTKVEDLSEILKGAVSAETKLSAGPFEIPIGTILLVIGRFFQGPRISGMLFREDDRLVITAQTDRFSWRVERIRAGATSPAAVSSPEASGLDEMIRELAYRIFTDLVLIQSVRWRATRAFAEGLQAYRDCLRTSRDRKINLKLAARMFIEALAEDEAFWTYYNLGIVYLDLKQVEAAELAFSKSIERDPNRWESYFALARIRFLRERYDDAALLCDRVLALTEEAAARAQASTVKAVCRLNQEQPEDAVAILEKTVARSWRALRAEVVQNGHQAADSVLIGSSGNGPSRLERVTSVTLYNLALAYGGVFVDPTNATKTRAEARAKRRSLRRAQALLCQAALLNRADADIYRELGGVYDGTGQYKRAIQAYRSALQITPDDPLLWANLAKVYSRTKDEQSMRLVRFACHKVLDRASMAVVPATEDLVLRALGCAHRVCKDVGDCDESQRLKTVSSILKDTHVAKTQIDELAPGAANADVISALEQGMKEYANADESQAREGREWEYAQFARALGEIYLLKSEPEPEAAERYFRQAIAALEPSYLYELRTRGLCTRLAQSLQRQKVPEKAVEYAEKGVERDPLGDFKYKVLPDALEYRVLAEVYEALEEYETAITVRQVALLWAPDDAEIHKDIGWAYVVRARYHNDQAKTDEAYRQGVIYLQKAAKLCDVGQASLKGQISYWLGALHYYLRKYDEAAPYFAVSRALGGFPWLSRWYQGWALLKARQYDGSEDNFRTLKSDCQGLAASEEARTPFSTIIERYGAGVTLGELLAMADQGLAFVYAERGVNLEEALHLCDEADERARELELGPTADLWRKGDLIDTRGWVLFKLGRKDIALQLLKKAVSLSAQADYYYHLAVVLESALQDTTDDSSFQALKGDLRTSCQFVQELDTAHEYSERVGNLLVGSVISSH